MSKIMTPSRHRKASLRSVVRSVSRALFRIAECRPGPEAAPPRRLRDSQRARRGTLYRGREGMWSWVAHRITGVLTFFFLFVHILDTALVRVSPESYDVVIDTYKNPFINLDGDRAGRSGAVPRTERPADHRPLTSGPKARATNARCCGRSSWCG